ncbi:MAG: N-acetyltransferase [Propionibacteriaceae bacterium]|nr:N-acetyltransferase [Propionibacteriaceae bacterium]
MSGIVVVDVPERGRYETTVDGVLAGVCEYQLTPTQVVLPHTKVETAFEGRGVGSALVRFAMDRVRADGTRKALPVCPFVAGWIERHPEYLDITDGDAPSNNACSLPSA